MHNHNKAQQSKNRVHISWDILYSDIRDIVMWLFMYHAISSARIAVDGFAHKYLDIWKEDALCPNV